VADRKKKVQQQLGGSGRKKVTGYTSTTQRDLSEMIMKPSTPCKKKSSQGQRNSVK